MFFNKYPNQYLISSAKEIPPQLAATASINFCEFKVFSSEFLQITKIEIDKVSILLIGYIIDPLEPKLQNLDIVKKLANTCFNSFKLIECLENYSGRYVIIYNNSLESIALNDAFGSRQIYFLNHKNDILISSSPEALLEIANISPLISDNVFELLDSKDYQFNESPWVGDKWYDKRIRKILPNHFLDLKSLLIKRTPLNIKNFSEKELVELSIETLVGTMVALSNRFNSMYLPITGGWDSRLILSSSKPLKDKIKYYIFINSSQQLLSADVRTATILASELNIPLEIILTQPLREDFQSKYLNFMLFPRLLPKVSNIQWHFYNNKLRDKINLNGNGGEILRRVHMHFENRDGKVEVKDLIKTRVYNWFFKDEISDWYEESKNYCSQYKINMLDLFYWEQRMGNWHAQYQFEQDIAIDELSIFNNKRFILAFLNFNPSMRKKADCYVCKQVMKRLWPEVLNTPFNPIYGINLKRRFVVSLRKTPNIFIPIKKIQSILRH